MKNNNVHIHLDLVGGIAGDMFVAAMLDAFPELEPPLAGVICSLALDQKVTTHIVPASDMGLNGKGFSVSLADDYSHRHEQEQEQEQEQSNHRGHGSGHSHAHHHWKTIREFLKGSSLEKEVRQTVIGIFQRLAEAESKVHNQDIESVQFHEVGAWDCIVDIVSAAWLIVHSNAASWSVSDLPWGGGTVKCAHGNIPVPAPATVNLLKGFRFVDDGNSGERITPTGAAILSWLSPAQKVSTGLLNSVGYGFGSKKLKDRANVLRVSILELAEKPENEQVFVIQCDIDDMTNEMLAIAREKIRLVTGVLEVTEAISHGKKNRIVNTLTVLAQPMYLNDVLNTVLNQTSTIGVRYWQCDRVCLERTEHKISDGAVNYRVKTVRRPDSSISSKLEADHLTSDEGNYQNRIKLKRTIEQEAEEKMDEFS